MKRSYCSPCSDPTQSAGIRLKIIVKWVERRKSSFQRFWMRVRPSQSRHQADTTWVTNAHATSDEVVLLHWVRYRRHAHKVTAAAPSIHICVSSVLCTHKVWCWLQLANKLNLPTQVQDVKGKCFRWRKCVTNWNPHRSFANQKVFTTRHPAGRNSGVKQCRTPRLLLDNGEILGMYTKMWVFTGIVFGKTTRLTAQSHHHMLPIQTKSNWYFHAFNIRSQAFTKA